MLDPRSCFSHCGGSIMLVRNDCTYQLLVKINHATCPGLKDKTLPTDLNPYRGIILSSIYTNASKHPYLVNNVNLSFLLPMVPVADCIDIPL